MVALVLVSHSRKLAEATRDLVLQMTGPEFPVVVASGVGENHDDLGTDAIHIAEVLQKLESANGILVLMDLGSAVLSAQTALELLESNTIPIRLCAAPLVEGAIAAAVSAQAGCSLEEVAAEAGRGLSAKQQQLLDDKTPPARAAESHADNSPPGASAELLLTVENLHGLHARPAAALVRTASRFRSSIEVSNLTSGAGPVTARSLTSLALLQVRKGDRIKLVCAGSDCEAALTALRDLADAGFGEPLDAPAMMAPSALESTTSRAKNGPYATGGSPGSDGIAIGPLTLLQDEELADYDTLPGEPASEMARVSAAVRSVSEELLPEKGKSLRGTAGDAILEAQALLLADPAVMNKVESLLESKRLTAPRAWMAVTGDVAAQYLAMDDPYLRERAVDVRDIARRVLRQMLTGTSQGVIHLPRPSILLVEELLPSEAAACESANVLGVIAARGSATAHSAIIMRTLGIPMVVGAVGVSEADTGKMVAMDGSTGKLWIEPDAHTIAELEEMRQRRLCRKHIDDAASAQPSISLDGTRIEVLANAGNASDSAVAAQNGAEGIGLLRTEFLFVSRREAPSEDEQVHALREMYAPIGGPIIVRTLDVGADKPLTFLPQAEEHNPYLGVRGIRLSLQSPTMFLPHLRAILRSGVGHDLWLMFPMIARAREVEEALGFLEQAHLQLEAASISHAWPIKRGVMVEVPSAALLSEQLAQNLDFFSIGTNDLTQYTMAAERGNAALGELHDALHPAVLRLTKSVVDGARHWDRHVSVCGDAASDPLAAMAFAGLGIHSLSVRPKQVPEIKALFRQLRLSELTELAREAIHCQEASAVRALMKACVEKATAAAASPDLQKTSS